MELTLDVRESTVASIKEYATTKGRHLNEVTHFISQVASDSIERALRGDQLEAPVQRHAQDIEGGMFVQLRPSTIQMLKGYSHIVSSTPEDVLFEIQGTLSDELEKVLKKKIATAIGITQPSQELPPPNRVVRATYNDTTGITDGLGDEDLDLDPVTPEAESDPEANVPSQGGLTDKDLEEDMEIDNPDAEAKADASTFSDMIAGTNTVGDGTDLFAEVAGFEADYVDPRIAKRKKGPSKSKGKVRGLTETVEREVEG